MGAFTAVFFNRGFHALLFYRFSHALSRKHIPVIPLVLTRVIQILYAIDIDIKADLEGGQVIVHGVGVVIGGGVIIKSNCTIYHGVTLGRKKQGYLIPEGDGYPTILSNCVLGAGVKVIGPVIIGENCIVGPNCVITQSVLSNRIIKINEAAFSVREIHS